MSGGPERARRLSCPFAESTVECAGLAIPKVGRDLREGTIRFPQQLLGTFLQQFVPDRGKALPFSAQPPAKGGR